jgi:hypothetical protein
MARTGIVGLGLATAVALRLVTVLPEVPNRHALASDAAQRAMAEVEAADALLEGDVLELPSFVAGQEPGSTLLLLVAAPAHALAGKAHALGVQLGISVAFTALLFLVLGLAARCVVPTAGEAMVVLAISTPILMGNRDLLAHAVNGTVEVPSAVFTLAMAAAWLASRASRTFRPWAVALLGNALFHVKFELGLVLGLAVLMVEAGVVRPPRARPLGPLPGSAEPGGSGAARTRPDGAAGWMVAGEHRRPERHRLRAGGEPPQCPGPDRLRGTAALSLRRARLLAGAGLAGGRGSSAGEVPLELAAHADDRLAPRALHLAAPDPRSGVRQCRGRAGLAAGVAALLSPRRLGGLAAIRPRAGSCWPCSAARSSPPGAPSRRGGCCLRSPR